MSQRQQKAVLLKERIPRASIMSELELAELRADIKVQYLFVLHETGQI